MEEEKRQNGEANADKSAEQKKKKKKNRTSDYNSLPKQQRQQQRQLQHTSSSLVPSVSSPAPSVRSSVRPLWTYVDDAKGKRRT